MKNPWIKLWRSSHNDSQEILLLLVRRYGHECMTFWINLQTRCEDGVLLMDEDLFMDFCVVEEKRYTEIKNVFLKRGLISLNVAGQMVLVDWAEYQSGESTERVRRFRERGRNGEGTPGKRDETGEKRPETKTERVEGEGYVEGEGEGEHASASEAPLPALEEISESEKQAPQASSLPAPLEAEAAQDIVRSWFAALNQHVGGRVSPPPRAEDWARSIVQAIDGDLSRARDLQAEYFSSWRELWFACTRGSKGLPPDKRAPDFDFRMYCTQAPALLARLAAKVSVAEDRRFSTAPPPTPEEARPATEEDLALVDRIIETAALPPALAGALGAANRRAS